MIRGIRDLWKRYRGFGDEELETLKRSTLELKAEVERLRASAAARRHALETAALAEARAAVDARVAAADAVSAAEEMLESAGMRAERDLEAMVKERAARVVEEGGEALERVILAEMMRGAEAGEDGEDRARVDAEGARADAEGARTEAAAASRGGGGAGDGDDTETKR